MQDHTHAHHLSDKAKLNHAKPFSVKRRYTSQHAVWSVCLGVFGFGCCVFLGIPAIICGLVALARMKREPNRLKGAWMAIVGIISGLIGILMDVIYWTH